MEGFKQNQKMKCDLPCFKEGGFVKRDKAKHSESTEVKKDVAKDKKIVKKAFKIHDEQSHDEKTDLSKLKKGGRAKKEVGTVKKYKTGGCVKKMAGGGLGAQTDAELAMASKAAAPSAAFQPGSREDLALKQKMAPRKRRRPMTAGMGAVSDTERAMLSNAGMGDAGMAGMGAVSDAERAMLSNAGMGDAGMAGMGAVSDAERMNMMRGLQAVGQYCSGGKV